MSLAYHVTQREGFEYEAQPLRPEEIAKDVPVDVADDLLCTEATDPRPEWKQLTFNPFSAPEAAAEAAIVGAQPHIAAYRVSDLKRCVQVATGVVACWLASGIVFGFAALKPVLIAEGVFSELCSPESRSRGVDDGTPCPEQDIRLNFFFVVGSVTTNVSSLVAGAALDRFGRRSCWLASCVFLAVGCLLLGYSFAIPAFDAYTVGNLFLALGGTFVFVPSFQLANAFPLYSGAVVALVTGAFDASAAVFLLYRMLYDRSGGQLGLDKFFFAFLLVPCLILVAELGWMPPRGYHTMPELEHKIERALDSGRDRNSSDSEQDGNNSSSNGSNGNKNSDNGSARRMQRAERRIAKLDQIEDLVGDESCRVSRIKAEAEKQQKSIVWGVLHGLPAHRQMMSPWFILVMLLTVVQMLRMNYLIASIREQYRYMLGSDAAAEAITHFFDVALPVGGVAATPFVGFMLSRVSVPFTFAVVACLVAAGGVLNCLPFVWAAYLTVVTFVVFRPLYYSAISDYATKVFGFTTFGRIYGMIVCASGLVNFSQEGLDALTHGPLGGDPTLINVGLVVVGGFIAVLLTIFIFIRAKVFAVGKMEMALDQERQKLLLDDEEGGYGTLSGGSAG